MTKLYIIRHCEAMGNLKRIFQGSTDCEISPLGAKQLECLRKRFKEIPLDRVYSSPLIRAQKTAHAVADDKSLPVEVRNDLRELNGGYVEGKPFAETFRAAPLLADTWHNHPQDFAPEGGEPMRHAYERIWNEVSTLVKENPNKSIAIATHGGVIRCLLARLITGTIERLNEVNWTENTSVSLVEFDENLNFKIVFNNDYSHLPDELLPKRSRMGNLFEEKE